MNLGGFYGKLQVCLCWQNPKLSLNTYTAGCFCQLGTPSLEGSHRTGLVCMNLVDISHSWAERLRANRENLLAWDKDSLHTWIISSSRCTVLIDTLTSQSSRIYLWWRDDGKKQMRYWKGSFRGSKNLLWRACWCPAAKTLKAYLQLGEGLKTTLMLIFKQSSS